MQTKWEKMPSEVYFYWRPCSFERNYDTGRIDAVHHLFRDALRICGSAEQSAQTSDGSGHQHGAYFRYHESGA